MRPLTDVETERVFEKLANYIGRNITHLLTPPGTPHVFRTHHNRVYYVSLPIANLATSISRHSLVSLGTCLGKFTKTGKFKLHVTALPYLAEHAKFKIWVKPNGEMPFLYGNHVLKAHVGRMAEEVPEHQGIVVLAMNETPLGFGVTARGTNELRRLEPTGVAAFRQADVGEYLRDEDTLF